MAWLWRLTGGRPMIWREHRFIDTVSRREVSLYTDRRNGDTWLADGAWSLFRIPAKMDENE